MSSEERTLRRPDGEAQALWAREVVEPRGPEAPRTVALKRLVAGINPLLGAAEPLLALTAKLRGTPAHADRPALRRMLLEQVAEFEQRARASGMPKPQVTAARYLLCTFLDEVIAGTPWGAQPMPGLHGLLQEFHEEASGAEKAFELAERLLEDEVAHRDLIELFAVCLALGFEGQHAGRPHARVELDALRARLLQATGHRGEGATPMALSPQAAPTGERLRAKALAALPLWTAAAAGAAVVVAGFTALALLSARAAAPLMQDLHAVRAALTGPADADVAAVRGPQRLAPLLQAEAEAAALTVRDEPQRSVVTLAADALFTSGTALLAAGQGERLARLARVLAVQPGRIEVIAHSDDRRHESLRHPSNWHLTRAQALAVLAALRGAGVPSERLRAEGRADVEPRAANDSEAGRASNRRVEIQLLLARPDPPGGP